MTPLFPDLAEPGTDRYHCVVIDCDWHHDEPPLDPRIDATTLAEVFGPDMMAVTARNARNARIEHILREHLETHTVEEWVRTVMAGRRLVAGMIDDYATLTRELAGRPK